MSTASISQYIRDFCRVQEQHKLCTSPCAHEHKLRMIAENVDAASSYHLLPEYQIYPAEYPLGKKSMKAQSIKQARMLAKASYEQSLQHRRLTETHTRCIIEKGKYAYVYYDLATGLQLPYKEFERRYLDFVNKM